MAQADIVALTGNRQKLAIRTQVVPISELSLRAELVPRFATYDNNGRLAASHIEIFADFPFIWNIRYVSQKSARKLKQTRTRMSKLERLKKTKSLSDLAKLLGFTPKGLSYVIHQIPDAKKYRVFDVPKKTGGTRTIKAPVDQLSLLQSRLAELLTECVEELIKDNPRYWAASHGFRKSRTIVSNANAHRKRRYVFNIDFQTFSTL